MRNMGGMGGMGGLMAQAQKMQQKLAKVQEELKAKTLLQPTLPVPTPLTWKWPSALIPSSKSLKN